MEGGKIERCGHYVMRAYFKQLVIIRNGTIAEALKKFPSITMNVSPKAAQLSQDPGRNTRSHVLTAHQSHF